jgi:GWxTD domain-containing protein
MRKNYFLILIAFVLSVSTIGAQNNLSFEFDYARFKYDNNSVFLEFYYNLNAKDMKIIEVENNKMTEAIVHIEMKDLAADTFFIKKDWKIQNVIIKNDSTMEVQNLTGVLGFQVPAGNYSLEIKAYDVNNENLTKVIKENIQITPFGDNYAVSDIELASNIKNLDTDPNSIFYKNTFEVIPNPSMLFSDKTPAAFYYAELYNLTSGDSGAGFTLQKLLLNSAGINVYKSDKKIKQSASSIVEVGVINLAKYPTDSYNLVLSLIDDKTNKAYLSSKRFYHYNPGVVDTTLVKTLNSGVLGSSFALLTLEECDKMFSESKYIATQNEIDRYGAIDSLDAKRTFLMNFWKSRDTEPSTPQNEFQQDYMRRVAYANLNFKHAQTDGYKTDRGRVYLIYGEPDQRDLFPNESNLKPYEVWFYSNIEGGVSFYFGDVTGFGKYELLHSTKRGEFKDENWMYRLSASKQ